MPFSKSSFSMHWTTFFVREVLCSRVKRCQKSTGFPVIKHGTRQRTCTLLARPFFRSCRVTNGNQHNERQTSRRVYSVYSVRGRAHRRFTLFSKEASEGTSEER